MHRSLSGEKGERHREYGKPMALYSKCTVRLGNGSGRSAGSRVVRWSQTKKGWAPAQSSGAEPLSKWD